MESQIGCFVFALKFHMGTPMVKKAESYILLVVQLTHSSGSRLHSCKLHGLSVVRLSQVVWTGG